MPRAPRLRRLTGRGHATFPAQPSASVSSSSLANPNGSGRNSLRTSILSDTYFSVRVVPANRESIDAAFDKLRHSLHTLRKTAQLIAFLPTSREGIWPPSATD